MSANVKRYIVVEIAESGKYFPRGIAEGSGRPAAWSNRRPMLPDDFNVLDLPNAERAAQALGDYLREVHGLAEVARRLRIEPVGGGAATGWRWNELRVKDGDIVRLYSYPGRYEVSRVGDRALRPYEFYATAIDGQGGAVVIGFAMSSSSVVEINGEPRAMLSCPIAEPADDYPWEPMFCYADGPQANGERIRKRWYDKQREAAGGKLI